MMLLHMYANFLHTLIEHIILFSNIQSLHAQYGNSPLLASIKEGHTEVAKLLTDKGADVNKFDQV